MSRYRQFRTPMAALLAAVALVVTGCETEGKPDDFKSGLKQDAPTPDIVVENVTDEEVDQLAVATIADLNGFWGELVPNDYDQPYEPPQRLISYRGEQDDIGVCGMSTIDVPMNAFYCEDGNETAVAWDRLLLFPTILDLYGQVAIVTVMAHEWGHAMQHRLGEKAGIDTSAPTATQSIVTELQADCFTGAYAGWVVEGNSEYFDLASGPGGLNNVLSALYWVRDAPGAIKQQMGAHGSAFDRTLAFQEGFEGGHGKCSSYTYEMLSERTTQQRFNEQDIGQGDAIVDEEILRLVEESLNFAFDGVQAPAITTGGAACSDGEKTKLTAYCAADNTVTVDLAALAAKGEPIDRAAELSGQHSTGYGDFAAYGSVASRYALAVQQAQGADIEDENTPQRTACLVGAWADLVKEPREESANQSVIRLSPGDVDEAVLEMLQPDTLIASDVNGNSVRSGFDRIEAFRVGFLEGKDACGQRYP